MMTASTKCMKYLLFIFNFFFVAHKIIMWMLVLGARLGWPRTDDRAMELTGISLITTGIIIKSANEEYEQVLEPDYITAPNLLIFMGSFVFFVAFFGCCGALRENHCMIFTFSVIMTAIFVAEVAIGVTGYMLRAETTEVLTRGLNNSMAQYNKTVEATRLWDDLQGELTCCGTKNYTDWLTVFNTTKDLPMTCCASQLGRIGVTFCTPDSPTLHTTPCIVALGDTIRENASSIGVTGITLAFVQLLGVIFSCSLAHSIRNNYESV